MTSKLVESSKKFLKPQEHIEELSKFLNQESMRLESDLTQLLKKTLEPYVTAGMILKQELERNERQTMLAPDPSTTLKLCTCNKFQIRSKPQNTFGTNRIN
jgi:hypothetical protein